MSLMLVLGIAFGTLGISNAIVMIRQPAKNRRIDAEYIARGQIPPDHVWRF